MELPHAIAIDMGGTHLRGALVDRNGKILAQRKEKTKADTDTDGVVAQICAMVEAVRADTGDASIAGVGLSAPGPIDTRRGIILGGHTIPGTRQLAIRDLLQTQLGLPVAVENDGIAAAVGEGQFGAGQGCMDFVYVSIGTGIGGGGVVNGRPLRGRDGFAGHLGHMIIHPGGEKCFCGNLGCWEAYGCGVALMKMLAAHGHDDFERFVEDALAGAASTTPVIDSYGDIIGLGIVSLIHIFNPETIVIGGGVSRLFDCLLAPISRRVEQSAMVPFQDTPIRKSALADNAGLLGAAHVLFEQVG